jgi:hypothetical protein
MGTLIHLNRVDRRISAVVSRLDESKFGFCHIRFPIIVIYGKENSNTS